MKLFKKTSPRRSTVRKHISTERLARINELFRTDNLISALLGLIFVALCVPILAFEHIQQRLYVDITSIVVIVSLISLGAAFYIHHYQRRIIENHIRAVALIAVFLLLLAATKLGSLLTEQSFWATGTAVTAAIVLAIAYDQRFAIGLGVVYSLFASFATEAVTSINLLLTMTAGVVTCCFALREIRTRMKLLEVGALTAAVVLVIKAALGFWEGQDSTAVVIRSAGVHAGAVLIASVLMQSLLPLIEKIFHIATSMTLLDYSDANQPLLKRLAMEAPGTFSHSLLVGSIAEAAAESIGCNGLLCRVGAYYHDIGKVNKPGYFVENEMGPVSRHKQLSPAMSQLVIIGHVKDGIEMAKEYGLPAVLRQFIESHHGTTLIEYFYNEAKKQQGDKKAPPSESEFRYAGPKPKTKEAAIAMLSDTIEGAVRSLTEVTPTKIEAVVHNMTMKRLQDGQFDECDLSLRELNRIETSISKSLAAHYHGRIAYPTPPDQPQEANSENDK